LCIKLVKYCDKYTEMHGQLNVKIYNPLLSPTEIQLLSFSLCILWSSEPQITELTLGTPYDLTSQNFAALFHTIFFVFCDFENEYQLFANTYAKFCILR